MIDEIPHTPEAAPAEIPHAPLPPALPPTTAAPGWRQETTNVGGGLSGLGVYTHDALPGKRFLSAPEGFVEQRLPGDTTPTPPLTIPRSRAEIEYTLRRGVEDLTHEYQNSISVAGPKSMGGDVGVEALGVKTPFHRVKSPAAQEFVRQILANPVERPPDPRTLSIGEKAEVHKALYDTLHDYQVARTNYHIATATADEYAPAEQALYEQARKYVQANPAGDVRAFRDAVHEGFVGFSRHVVGLANPNEMEQFRINQAQRYLEMARGEEHPLATGAGSTLGNVVSPESIAAMIATAGVVNPLEEGLAAEGTELAVRAGLGAEASGKVGVGGAKLATAYPKGVGFMTAPRTAERIAAGEKVTPGEVLKDSLEAIPAVLAGEAGGALTEKAAAGVPASLKAPVRLAGAAGSGAAANIAAGVASQGRMPTAEEALEQGISGAVVGGVTGLPGARGEHPSEIPHETPTNTPKPLQTPAKLPEVSGNGTEKPAGAASGAPAEETAPPSPVKGAATSGGEPVGASEARPTPVPLGEEVKTTAPPGQAKLENKTPEEIPHEQSPSPAPTSTEPPAGVKVSAGDDANGASAGAKEGQTAAVVKYSREAFDKDLREKFNLPDDQAAAVLAIADARAATWAKERGKTAEDYYPTRIAGVTNEGVEKNATPDNPLLQSSFENASAMVSFQKDGKALIRALKSPTVASAVHELGHIFRRDLSPADLKASEEWAGDDEDFPLKNGRWERFHEERFARGFEVYLREGKAPTTAMAKVFAKFKEWLTAIYHSVIGDAGFEFGEGHPLNVHMTDEMRATFDRMLGKEPPAEIPHETPNPKGASDAVAVDRAKTMGSFQGGVEGAGEEGGGGNGHSDPAGDKTSAPGKAQGEGGAAKAEVDATVKAKVGGRKPLGLVTIEKPAAAPEAKPEPEPTQEPTNEETPVSARDETGPTGEGKATGLTDREVEPTYEGKHDKYGQPAEEYRWVSSTNRYAAEAGEWRLVPATYADLHVREAAARGAEVVPAAHEMNPSNPKEAKQILAAYNSHQKNQSKYPASDALTERSLDAVNAAYKTLLKPVPVPPELMRSGDLSPDLKSDTQLWALPGKEKEMQEIAQKMAKARDVKPYELEMASLKTAKIKGVPVPAKTTADVLKALLPASAKEQTRYAINGTYIEKGGKTAATTDGHRLFVVKGEKALGKPGVWGSGKGGSELGKKVEGTFPPYKDILDSARDADSLGHVNIEKTLRRLRQAEAMTSPDSRGVAVMLNTDGSLGFASRVPEAGVAEVGIHEGAKELGGINPQYLREALEFHAKMGADKEFGITMKWKSPNKPLLLEGISSAGGDTLKHTSVTMPIPMEKSSYEAVHHEIAAPAEPMTETEKGFTKAQPGVAEVSAPPVEEASEPVTAHDAERTLKEAETYFDGSDESRKEITDAQSQLQKLTGQPLERITGETDEAFIARKFANTKSGDLLPEPKSETFSNTKAALKAAVKDLTMPGDTTLGSGFGNLSKAFEHAVNISVALIKDLSAAGKHGFEAFVKAISEHVSDARLRNLMIHGERDPETKKMVGGARELYNAAREQPDIIAHGHQHTMTPADELPNAFRVAELARRTPEQLAAHEEQRAAAAALPPKPPTETQTIRAATVPQTETTKGTILRTTGARSVEEPTITASKALAEKLNVEAALTGKAWLGQDARAKITASAKELPRELRGDFLHAIATAKNQGDVERATQRMTNNLATHQLRESYVAGANTLAQHRLANIPLEFSAKARAEGERLKAILSNVRELPNRPRPKGEPAASPEAMDAYRAQIDDSVKKINEHIEAGKQFMRDQITWPGSVPAETSKPAAPGLKRTTADILHEVLSPTEQYSYLRRNYNPDVQATAHHLLQARKETVGTYNDFLAKALPKKHADAMRVMGDLVRLGWHNRVNDMRSKAFQDAIDAGLDHEAAVAASERVGTGIPDTGAANAAKIKADPLVRKAALYWLDTIAPAQDANLTRSGQSIAGWASKSKELADPLDGMMINLPPERPSDAEHFGVRRRSYNQAEALLDETTGNAEYLKDFPRVVQNNIAYPIRARTNAEFAKAVERGGFLFDPDSPDVRQASDGRVYVKAHGVERLAKAVLVDDKNGQPQPRFVPQELANIPQFSVPELKGIPKLAGKFINAYVTARLAAGADVGYHVWRELGNTGAILAREGTAANLVPWAGGRVLAAERAYRAMTLPHGDMLKLLANRLGFDRGTGYYATEHEPATRLQKVIQFGHQILFHPQWGVDTNIRSVVAESHLRATLGAERYEQITEAVNAGKLSKAAGADALADAMGGRGQIDLTNFVNNTLGVNNRTLRAEYLNKLSFVMPFIGQHVGPLPSEVGRFATGNIPFSSVLQHARKGNHLRASAAVVGGLMSGAVGAYLAANLLNYAATSGDEDGPKWLWDNAPGHRSTPFVLPGVYWTNMAPGDSRPARITGAQTALNDKSLAAGAADVPRNITNEITSTIPLLNPIFQLSGHSPYLTRNNMLMPSQPEEINPVSVGQQTVKAGLQHLRGNKDAEPMGQAAAKDVAMAAGERIAFQNRAQEAKARAIEEKADLALALRKNPKAPELLERLKQLPETERATIQKRATFKDDDAYKLLTTGKLEDMVAKLEGMGAEKLRAAAYSQPNALTKKYESYWDVANRRLYQANGDTGKISELKARMSAIRAQ